MAIKGNVIRTAGFSAALLAWPQRTAAFRCAALPANLCGGGKAGVYMTINFFANWLTGIIVLVAVLILVVSGIQLASSGGSPDAVKAARTRITQVVIGLVLLACMRLLLLIIFPPNAIG